MTRYAFRGRSIGAALYSEEALAPAQNQEQIRRRTVDSALAVLVVSHDSTQPTSGSREVRSRIRVEDGFIVLSKSR
jgi:hypothetical protein